MILPENCLPGDLVGIFSPNGVEFRGHVIVREVNEGFISFTSSLPQGTKHGDILCLIRRRDEHSIIIFSSDESTIVTNDIVKEYEQKVRERDRKIMELQNRIRAMKIRIEELELLLEGTPMRKGVGRRIKSSANNTKINNHLP